MKTLTISLFQTLVILLVATSGAGATPVTITFSEPDEGNIIPVNVTGLIRAADQSLGTGSFNVVGFGTELLQLRLVNFLANPIGAVGIGETFQLLEPNNLEPGGGKAGDLSDTITFSVNPNSRNLEVFFSSDPNPTSSHVYGKANETGDLQAIPLPTGMSALPSFANDFTLEVFAKSDAVVCAGPKSEGLTVLQESDACTIPIPSTLILVVTGTFGLVTFAWCRCQKPVKVNSPQSPPVTE